MTIAKTIQYKFVIRNNKSRNLLDTQKYSRRANHSQSNPPKLDSFKFSRGEDLDEKK